MIRSVSSLIFGLCISCQCAVSFAATAESSVVTAVRKALVYLVQQQNSDGSWGQSLDNKVKTTAEVYHVLSLLKILPVSRNAADRWLAHALSNDLEDRARRDYARRLDDASVVNADEGAGSRVSTADSTLPWESFYDCQYSTIDTALTLRALVRNSTNAILVNNSVINRTIDYLLKRRNQGEQLSALGSGWGFSLDDHSAHFESQLMPTAFALLALTEPDTDWPKVADSVMSAAYWLISKQNPEGLFGGGLFGDQSNDAETVLATLALARVMARDDMDALVEQAYLKGRNYLVGQLIQYGHISQSVFLTALALQTLPLTEIEFVDSDQDQVPDAIEQALGLKLQGSRFEGNSLFNGNGLLGKVRNLPPKIVFLVMAEPVQYDLVAGISSIEIVAGHLPPGLVLTDNRQSIVGIPRAEGVYDVHYRVLKKGQTIGTGTMHIHILEPDEDPDNDGVPTGYELSHQMNPLLQTDATLDPDLDGWTNRQEFVRGSHPLIFNSREIDDDGLSVQQEQEVGHDTPLVDTDRDTIVDATGLANDRNSSVNEPVMLMVLYLLL